MSNHRICPSLERDVKVHVSVFLLGVQGALTVEKFNIEKRNMKRKTQILTVPRQYVCFTPSFIMVRVLSKELKSLLKGHRLSLKEQTVYSICGEPYVKDGSEGGISAN